MTALMLLLWACQAPEPVGDRPPGPWKDTAVYEDFEPVVRLDRPPRNVVMISVDTLRRDHVGRYGEAPTPFLDGLLAASVVLDDFVQCANWTFGSVVCTLTGEDPPALGYFPELTVLPPQLLPPEVTTLAEHLDEAGFHTVLATTNTWLSPLTGFGQGYDAVHMGVDDDGAAVAVWNAGASLLDAGLAEGAERWFLHLHLFEPHAPYDPPAAYLADLAALDPAPWDLTSRDVQYEAAEEWPELPPDQQALLEAHLRVRYRGEVAWLDDQLATIWADLDARGWLDDALVVVWTDHGEQFWEHGRQTHAWQLHAEETDAIAAFWARGLAPVAYDGPTTAIDLLPTLLTALDLPVDPELPGVVVGGARPGRARFASTQARSGVEQAVLRDGHKLRYHWSGVVQLYDRAADPGEAVDLWDPDDPRARALWDALAARTEALAPLSAGTPKAPAGP